MYTKLESGRHATYDVTLQGNGRYVKKGFVMAQENAIAYAKKYVSDADIKKEFSPGKIKVECLQTGEVIYETGI